MFEVRIYITLKESVLDPQGMTILKSLKDLGYHQVENVRMGKFLQLWINETNPEVIKTMTDEMCKKLLVNEVIETYHYEIISHTTKK